MILGARTAAWAQSGGGGEWKNPYIMDGLVGYWDGEWNAGGGKHDSSLDSLVDLSGGGHDMTFVGTHQLNQKSVTIDGVANAYGSIDGLTWGPQSTQEFVLNVSDQELYGRIIAENKGLRLGSSINNTYDLGKCYGYNLDGVIGSVTIANFWVPYSVVLTFNGEYLKYYVNGRFADQRSTVFSSSFSGQTTFFNRTSGGRGVTGQIHAVRIYSRALSADEISDNYSVDKARFNLQ